MVFLNDQDLICVFCVIRGHRHIYKQFMYAPELYARIVRG
jgi:hypothetical protein